MAVRNTTASKKLRKAKKIEPRRPLKGVDISPIVVTKQLDSSSASLTTSPTTSTPPK